LIGQDGEQLGVKSKVEALKIAEQANLDVERKKANKKTSSLRTRT
jgi:translation initiation factor IF-3